MERVNGKEVGVSALKSLFSAIPYVGQVFNEALFDYWSRIKQNRLNSFVEMLTDFFLCSQQVDLDTLKTEDFLDLFESVIRRVVQTKSKEKHKRFKDVLTNQMINPQNSYGNAEIYLDIISGLSEVEVNILQHHSVFDEALDNKAEEIDKVSGEISRLEERYNKETQNAVLGYATNVAFIDEQIQKLRIIVEAHNSEVTELQKYRTHEFYGISAHEFLYYKQSLASKALMIDKMVGSIGGSAFQMMSITEFGKNFLNFITDTG